MAAYNYTGVNVDKNRLYELDVSVKFNKRVL